MSRQIISLADHGDVALAAAEAAVSAGGLVVVPTDTVYGIGADAFNAEAVNKLLDAKRRERDMPVPVLIADADMLDALAVNIPEPARLLATSVWPGAMTLILTMRDGLAMNVGETAGSIAVRVPAHEELRALLRRTGPMAVSSANVSGQPPAATCDEAVEQLGYQPVVYLDGGPTPGLTPSTIIDFHSRAEGRIVRPGKLTLDEIRAHAPLAEFA